MNAKRRYVDRSAQTWVDMHPTESGAFFVLSSRSVGVTIRHDVVLLSAAKNAYNVRTAWFEYEDHKWESVSDMRRIA